MGALLAGAAWPQGAESTCHPRRFPKSAEAVPRTRAEADQGRPGHCHLRAGICALIHSHARPGDTPIGLAASARTSRFLWALEGQTADGRRQTAFGFAISERIVRCDYKPCAERLPLRTAAGGARGHRSFRARGRQRPGTPGIIEVIHPQGSLCVVWCLSVALLPFCTHDPPKWIAP